MSLTHVYNVIWLHMDDSSGGLGILFWQQSMLLFRSRFLSPSHEDLHGVLIVDRSRHIDQLHSFVIATYCLCFTPCQQLRPDHSQKE